MYSPTILKFCYLGSYKYNLLFIFLTQVSSIKTWVSAAETDVITCTDGLSGGSGWKVRSKVKKEVKKCAVIVVRQISNALFLINNFKYKH